MRRLLLVVGVLAIPAVASAQRAETSEYYGTDAIGSIRIVWDASGNVIARQDFTPFGEPVLQQGTAIPKEGFGGNETDAETNQDYFHARMFEARTGRFTRADPIEDGVSEPQRRNRYAYALNNPVSFGDASGLNADPCGDNHITCTNVTAPFVDPDWSFGGGWTDFFAADSGRWAGGLSSDQDGRERGGGAITATTQQTTTTTTTNASGTGNTGDKDNGQTPCQTFAAGIVHGTASSVASNGFGQTGQTMINVALTNPWRVNRVSSASVKSSLTARGQMNGVFHHITFQVGAALSATHLTVAFTGIDVGQAIGILPSNNQSMFGTGESVAEAWDDVVGIVVAGEVGYGLLTNDLAGARQMVVRTVCK